MPYIKPEDSERAESWPAAPGELNYAITMDAICVLEGHMSYDEFTFRVDLLVNRYLQKAGISYTNMNAVMGALDCCGREIDRRVNTFAYGGVIDDLISILLAKRDRLYPEMLAPYEDQKIAENGDVYPDHLVSS